LHNNHDVIEVEEGEWRRCLVLMAKRRARGRRQPVLEAAERILRVDPLHRNARRARADLERLARTTGANKKLPKRRTKVSQKCHSYSCTVRTAIACIRVGIHAWELPPQQSSVHACVKRPGVSQRTRGWVGNKTALSCVALAPARFAGLDVGSVARCHT